MREIVATSILRLDDGHLKVKDSAASDFHNDKQVHHPERCGHDDEQITSDYRFGMITQEVIQRCDGTAGRFGELGIYRWTVRGEI
jgi:hypothetical protein